MNFDNWRWRIAPTSGVVFDNLMRSSRQPTAEDFACRKVGFQMKETDRNQSSIPERPWIELNNPDSSWGFGSVREVENERTNSNQRIRNLGSNSG